MFKAAFGGRPVSNVRPAAAPQAREQTQRPLSWTAMRPMRTRPDHPSAAISRSSPSLRQHAIDGSPPDLETLRDSLGRIPNCASPERLAIFRLGPAMAPDRDRALFQAL
jgi:hypothetical protein